MNKFIAELTNLRNGLVAFGDKWAADICDNAAVEIERLVAEEKKLVDYFRKDNFAAGWRDINIGDTPVDATISELKRLRKELTDAESRMTAKFVKMVREQQPVGVRGAAITKAEIYRKVASEFADKLLAKLEPPTMTHSEAILAVLQGATAKARRVAEPRAHIWYTDYANRISAEYPNGKEDIKATDWEVFDAHR